MIFKALIYCRLEYLVIENRGGIANAATDYAHYFVTTAAPCLNALPYLAELLLNTAIPDIEFVQRRDVVLRKSALAMSDADWIGFRALEVLPAPLVRTLSFG